MFDEKVEMAMEKVEELPKQLEFMGHQVRSFSLKKNKQGMAHSQTYTLTLSITR